MNALYNLVTGFVVMVCLMVLFAWFGFRVLPFVKSLFLSFGRGLAFVVHPIFGFITVVAKLLLNLSLFVAKFMFNEAKSKMAAKPVVVKTVMNPIRKDRLCQFKY